MPPTATLPLFPLAADPPAVPGAGGVEYRDWPAGAILNRVRGRRAPWDWSLNPYRGCEIGCPFCSARYTHGFLDLDGRDFERKILVKRDAGRALAGVLRRRALAGRRIAIGTVTDPYQPAERRYGVTRSLLEALLEAKGLELTLLTKSALVVRDRALLAALDRRHTVTVRISLTTVDPELARRLEPGAPSPSERLAAVAALAAEGIATMVCAMPLLPGIHDRRDVLDPLFAAAVEAGAFDLVGGPLELPATARRGVWAWLRRDLPALVPRYRKLYGRRGTLDRRGRRGLGEEFHRHKLRHGLPRERPGRG